MVRPSIPTYPLAAVIFFAALFVPADGAAHVPPAAAQGSLTAGEYTDCVPATRSLVFEGGYGVSLCYETAEGQVGEAQAGIWASGQAGLLWFFDRDNAEVLVKVLDGCAHNGGRWVFVAPVTDVAFNLHVSSSGGSRWTHRNRLGATAATRSDTAAFDCATEDDRSPRATGAIPPQTVMVGGTITVDMLAYFTDPDGDDLTYAAESSNAAVGAVRVEDSLVSVSALASGVAVITATASDPGGLSARQTFEVRARAEAAPTILRVDPAVLVEGETAMISGWGFSTSPEENDVLVDGISAAVLSSSATRLSITVPRADCLPPREVRLRVFNAGGRHAARVGLTPVRGEHLNWQQFEWRHTPAGEGCIHLPGSADGGEFLIGVTSVSEDPSRLTSVTLAGTPGDDLMAGASRGASARGVGSGDGLQERSSAGLAFPPAPHAPSAANRAWRAVPERVDMRQAVWRAAHQGAMARNQTLLAGLGQAEWSAGSSPTVVARSSLSAGDRATLNVPGQSGVEVEAVVRLVGEHTVWLDDVANPAETFTDAELMELDAFYASHVKPVHDAYFGRLSDVDGNGRLLVLMTVELNRRGYRGQVNFCDLYRSSQCGASNEAEIFYSFVPDPDGVAGEVFSKEFVRQWFPSLLTHEVTHLVQAAASVFGDASLEPWELEGGAVMAQELVGHRLFGHASGQDLGYAEWNAAEGRGWYDRLWGVFSLFSGGRGAPEECSWLTFKNRDGNDGPCHGSVTYGVSWFVLRFAMDRWGGQYPGGERALLRRLTQSPRRGFASLVDVSPDWSIERILGEFYATLWLEGAAGRAQPGMTSWDIHDVVSRLDDSWWLRPYSSSAAGPSVSARIRAGSSMFFHWTPDGPLPPTSFRVEPADDGPVFIWAIRVR